MTMLCDEGPDVRTGARTVEPDFLNRPDFRVLFESAPDLSLVVTPDFRIVAVNDRFLDSTTTRREAILGRMIFEVLRGGHNDASDEGGRRLRDSLETVVRLRVADAMGTHRHAHPGSGVTEGATDERYWSTVNSPVFGDDGEVAWIIHRIEEVTDSVRLAQRASEQDRFQQTLLDSCARLQVELIECIDQVEEQNRSLRSLDAALQAEIAGHRRAEERLRAADELQQSRNQVSQGSLAGNSAQAIAGPGKFTGSIVHEFNNLLSIVCGYSDVVASSLADDDPNLEFILEIQRAGERAAQLARQLLNLNRQAAAERQALAGDKTISPSS
jgi:PAS domain S-box-containing protein